MTIPVIKIHVRKKATVKGKASVQFVSVIAKDFLTVARANGIFTLGADYSILSADPIIDPAATLIAVYDEGTGFFKQTTLSALIASATQIDQHITAAGSATVLNNAGIVRVDQAVGAAITLNLPLSSAKTCPVLISDWKGDAGTNNITISLTGTDKFPGGLTSWTIAADTGSVFLRPIPGVGYAL